MRDSHVNLCKWWILLPNLCLILRMQPWIQARSPSPGHSPGLQSHPNKWDVIRKFHHLSPNITNYHQILLFPNYCQKNRAPHHPERVHQSSLQSREILETFQRIKALLYSALHQYREINMSRGGRQVLWLSMRSVLAILSLSSRPSSCDWRLIVFKQWRSGSL